MSSSIVTDVQPPGQGCSTLALDLFTDPPLDYSTKSFQEVEIYPQTPVDEFSKIIDFELEPSPFFLDTSNVEILFDLKITLENGDPLPPIHPAPFGEETSASLSDLPKRRPISPAPPPPLAPPPPPPLPSPSKLTSDNDAWALPLSNRKDAFPLTSPPSPSPPSSFLASSVPLRENQHRRRRSLRSASRARKHDHVASPDDDDGVGQHSDDSLAASPKAKRRRCRRDASTLRFPATTTDGAIKPRRRERKRRRVSSSPAPSSALDGTSNDDDDDEDDVVDDVAAPRSPRNKRRRRRGKGRRKHRRCRRRHQKRRRSIPRRERRNAVAAASDPYHSRPRPSPLTKKDRLAAPPPAPPNPDPPETFDGCNVENAIGVTLFQDCDIKISHQSVQSLNGHYALQSFVLLLNSYGEDWRKSRGELLLFDEEPDAANLDCRRPSTYRTRCFLFRNSEYVSVRAPVLCSFNFSTRYLLPMTHVSYHFYLQDPQKCLKSSDTTRSFRYSLRNVRLLAKKVLISDSLNLAVEKRLLSTPAKYYFDQIKTTSLIIPSGMREFSFDNVFSGSNFIPYEVFVFFINQSKALGQFQSSILDFRQYDVVSASFYSDSKKWPANQQRLSVKDNDPTGRLAAYANLFNSDSVFSDFGTYIDLQRFCTSMFFLRYTFDFRPTRCADAIQAPALGTVRFNVEFANETQEPIRCYLMSKHFVHLTLDHQRNLTRDYQL